jgi:hypothetical protein
MIEVNPFLADLIEAKLATYNASDVARSFAELVRVANRESIDPLEFFANGPKTLIEPGVGGRWIFDRKLAARLTVAAGGSFSSSAMPMVASYRR